MGQFSRGRTSGGPRAGHVELYRISSASNNAAPGGYRLPFDILREFLRGGVIDSNYLAAGTFSGPLLAEATAGVQFVMNNLGSRPVTNFNLRVRADTFAGACTVLETTDLAATPVNLFALGGGALIFRTRSTFFPELSCRWWTTRYLKHDVRGPECGGAQYRVGGDSRPE